MSEGQFAAAAVAYTLVWLAFWGGVIYFASEGL